MEIGNEIYGGPTQLGVGKGNVARDLTCQASIHCVVARTLSREGSGYETNDAGCSQPLDGIEL